MGFMLKAIGRRVIYDVHEDLPREILIKEWIRPQLRAYVASVMAVVEAVAGRAFDGVVAATPTIAVRFPPGKTVLSGTSPGWRSSWRQLRVRRMPSDRFRSLM